MGEKVLPAPETEKPIAPPTSPPSSRGRRKEGQDGICDEKSRAAQEAVRGDGHRGHVLRGPARECGDGPRVQGQEKHSQPSQARGGSRAALCPRPNALRPPRVEPQPLCRPSVLGSEGRGRQGKRRQVLLAHLLPGRGGEDGPRFWLDPPRVRP